jgi:LuxR family maltose regulon positive regulatory protein
MHLVIATRADPPLPIAGLRGRGQLTELRQEDLRFTREEAAAFLNKVAGLDVSAEDISALSARTEGWIAGLQMAAVSMQGREDLAQFVRAFAGSNVYVLDYLVEEVLDRQASEVQGFLLRTSILDRLSGSLCDAVMGTDGDETEPLISEGPSSQETLEALERSNLFIERLDDERRWYRYHRLFADLLRQRLQQMHPDLPDVLHRRASEWHESNGLIPQAIAHALSARDFERAACLVEKTAEATLARAEFVTFGRWIEALPEEILLNHPLLCTYDAVVMLVSGRTHEEVDLRLEQASQVDTEGILEGAIRSVRAVLVAFDGDYQQGIELARGAVDLLPRSSTFLLSFVYRALGFIYIMTGDAESATEAFQRGAAVGEKTGDLAAAVVAQEKVGSIRRIQ